MEKTTIMPGGDDAAALAQPVLKLIVIGNRPALAQIADDLALNPPYKPRLVVWYQQNLPQEMVTKYGITADVKAFSLSVSNKLGAKMLQHELEDYPGVNDIFDAAGTVL